MNLDERRILATMLQAKAKKTKIAKVLGRDRSTIHREIKRNWWHDEDVPQADGYPMFCDPSSPLSGHRCAIPCRAVHGRKAPSRIPIAAPGVDYRVTATSGK